MSATQLVPTLTVIEDEGDWIVNVGAQDNAPSIAQALVPVIAKLGGARKLSLITPTGIKSFKFNGASTPLEPSAPATVGASSVPVRRQIVPDVGAPPSEEDAQDEFERYLKEQEAAEQEIKGQQALNRQQLPLDEPEPEQKAVKRRKTPEPQVEAAGAACGRCQGAGALPGGGTCPVCRGKRVISKWGRKRR